MEMNRNSLILALLYSVENQYILMKAKISSPKYNTIGGGQNDAQNARGGLNLHVGCYIVKLFMELFMEL